MSGPHTEDPRLSRVELVPLYYEVLAAHADDLKLAYCQLCEQSRCDYWRFAYGELVGSGELLGAHERWRELVGPARFEP